MRFDPRDRLSRRLVGARLNREGAGMRRILARAEEVVVKKDLVPPRDTRERPAPPTVRAARHTAACTPNAPLLIRIVRWPKSLHPLSSTRKRYYEGREAIPRLERLPRIAEALADSKQVGSTSPGRGRPRPFAVRPFAWVLLPPVDHPGEAS